VSDVRVLSSSFSSFTKYYLCASARSLVGAMKSVHRRHAVV
jgi:hypothetical protein